ncbi:VOC family protein [Bdellovibrio sp. 22V]|uniref:VOC family protein n=1 Tax=Bdellovibrio TaxID=958 RepID=UPI002542717A|nr:VOC family protein [Bdellovibrio sp. 22V]WII72061.1 VOC family protein [Bdellovibrio sp. 22V]
MQKIVPNLWFDNNAEDAVRFYLSVFRNSRIKKVARYGVSGAKASGMPEGSVMTIDFQLEGQDFVAINGGPVFQFSHAISLMVNCENQKEIDTLWEKLSADGGAIEECGWLRDKYGLSWQIVPAQMATMISDAEPERTERMLSALFKMKKIDIRELERAYNNNRDAQI